MQNEPTLLAKTSLLSPAELNFFKALQRAFGRKYYISLKVRLADLIDCGGSAWEHHGKKIALMHVDFVLLRPKSFNIVACVELDDSSHDTYQTNQRDRIKTNAIQAAGIPLIRFRAARTYYLKSIKKAIYTKLAQG